MTNEGQANKPRLPDFDELPKFHEFSGCAWDVWGRDDQLGTVNLLTEEVVKRAAQEEIRTGRSVSLNWPINFPEKPLFGRKEPHIIRKARDESIPTRDDEIHINTQSGSQWDGLRHFGVIKHKVFYNNTPLSAVTTGEFVTPDPKLVDPESIKLGMQNWAKHGICGRGVLLDLVRYFTREAKPLPYDPWKTHGFTVAELEACAKYEGVEFRQGDIVLIRGGFIKRYYESTQEEKDGLRTASDTFAAGIEQSEDMKRFLWNNHFAAAASDQPTLESWPAAKENAREHTLHQTILGLWGMPLGELFDLEELSEVCYEKHRYSFFFSSWPLHILGGCASPPNAAAYF